MIIDYFKKLVFLLGEEKTKLPLIFLSFLILSLLDLLGLGLIGPFMGLIIQSEVNPKLVDIFNKINLPSDRNSILYYSSFFVIIIFFIKALATIFVNWYIIRFSQFQRTRLSSELINMYQNISYLSFIDKNTSSYVYTVHTLTSNYVGVVRTSLKIISDVLVSVSVLTILIYTNFKLMMIIAILFSAIAYFYDILFKNKMVLYGIQANYKGEEFLKNINESLSGLKEMRILGFMEFFRRKSVETCKNLNLINEKKQVIMILPRQISEFIFVSILIIFVLFKINSPNLTEVIPSLAVFAFAALRILPIINSFSLALLNFRHDHDVLKRLFADYNLAKISKEDRNNDKIIKNEAFEEVELKNIYFSYSNKKKVLENISLKIKKGEMIGIIGSSGSGKTTLVDIIIGLIKPSNGKILIKGKDSSISLRNFQKQVAYIPQETFIIDDTLKANIAIGVNEKNIDENFLNESIKMSKVNEFVDQFQNGINSRIGEQASKVSGGQKQRIALARAFYHQREFIVMDESTSSLDTKIEKGIVDSIKDINNKKTIVIIAHRLSTLKYCNTIYKIENMKIKNLGSYNEAIKS